MRIYSWKEWGAKANPADLYAQTVASTGTVFLHHSVTRISRWASVTQEKEHMRMLERIHLGNGWSAIGYSFIVFPSGRIYRGRGFNHVTAAQAGHNTGNGAICLVGDFTRDKTTWPQRRSVIEVARTFPGRNLSWHGRVNGTECPGANVKAVAPRIAELARKRLV